MADKYSIGSSYTAPKHNSPAAFNNDRNFGPSFTPSVNPVSISGSAGVGIGGGGAVYGVGATATSTGSNGGMSVSYGQSGSTFNSNINHSVGLGFRMNI